MQESWKHSIHPATTLTPHPIANTARINITYRYYRQSYSPKRTPACKCGVEGVLRCVMKKGDNLGRYYWTCHVGKSADPEGEDGGCDWFEWAEMDARGENVHPLRNKKREKREEQVGKERGN
jgi:hypothetical protein